MQPFPFSAWQWLGDRFEPCAALPLSDRGFRYGMSVFESFPVIAGDAEFLEQHLHRLLQACAEREFPIDDAACSAAETLLQEQKLSGFVRLYVTAGDGAPSAPATAPRIFLFHEERAFPPADNVCEITFHDEAYRPVFGGLKTGNYWFHCDALAQARARGFDEALLFNERAELVSAAMANVFLLREDRLFTPPRSSGARSGVIREWVMARRKVAERRLRREDVVNADEIFLTNSWVGVLPVATVEGRPLGRRWEGPKLAAELASRRP
ncbi:MAG TPA: aminotransferase class IV [Chthoniobacteraceae bacterium]|jgi:branched-subunit amino acid aminotransferase/4-amino-4-deoxychorismate lyase